MGEDPIVSEVRRIREQLARKFNFDLHAIFADLRERQTSVGSRLVRRPKKPRADHAGGPGQESTTPHPGR
jgi:hypothetical protein